MLKFVRRIGAMLIVACTMLGCRSGNEFRIHCIAPDCEGDSLIVVGQSSLTRFGAKVEDGEATVIGTILESESALVLCGASQLGIILEKGDIEISLAEKCATGTPLNDALRRYTAESDSLQEAFAQLYDSAMHDRSLTADLRMEKLEGMVTRYNQATLARARKVIADNSENPLGRLVFLADIAHNDCMTPKLYEAEIAAASPYIAAFAPIENATKRFRALSATAVGEPYTDLAFANARLSDFVEPEKLTLVHFWASWSEGSKATTRALSSIYNKYSHERLSIVNINTWDNEQDARAIVDQLQLQWPQIYGADSEQADVYAFNDLPFVMLIGSDGLILARNLRANAIEHWVSTELKRQETP